MKISHELKMKIISNYKGVNIEQYHNEIDVFGRTTIIPLHKEIELSLDLSDDLDLFKECAKWIDMGMSVLPIDMKLNIGPFIGLFPTEVNINNNTVIFIAYEYNSNNQNWKDWFIMEEL
jgi:hypothetical protein